MYISKVQPTIPITYQIHDYNSNPIKGSFYSNELQLVDKSSGIYPIEKIVKKRKRGAKFQYLVKYIGYSEDFNSWIDQEELFDL